MTQSKAANKAITRYPRSSLAAHVLAGHVRLLVWCLISGGGSRDDVKTCKRQAAQNCGCASMRLNGHAGKQQLRSRCAPCCCVNLLSATEASATINRMVLKSKLNPRALGVTSCGARWRTQTEAIRFLRT